MSGIKIVNGASDAGGDECLGPPSDGSSSLPAGIAIYPVLPNGLAGAWPQVKSMVREAVRWSPFTRKLQTVNDVERRLYAGEYRLWLVFRDGEVIAALLTQVVEETQCKVLDIAYGAGRFMDEWIGEFYAMMDDLACEMDCKFIRIEGREGWGKPLGKLGFEEAYRAYMIEV